MDMWVQSVRRWISRLQKFGSQRPAANQVPMEVEHGLARLGAAVGEEPEPAVRKSDRGGDLRQCAGQCGSDSRTVRVASQLQHVGEVDLRHDEDVDRRNGMDIVESDEHSVLIDAGRWNLPSDDPAEDAFVHSGSDLRQRGLLCCLESSGES